MDYIQTKQAYEHSNSTFGPDSGMAPIPSYNYNPEKVFNQTHRPYIKSNQNKLKLLSTPVKCSKVSLGNLRNNKSSGRRKISAGVIKDFNCD